MAEELVRLEIPAQPAFVGVARSVVATVATTVDGIDDAAGGLSAEAIAEQGWGLQLMTALVDDVDFTRTDGATGVTLRVKLQP